jgi:hypothetical protein
VSELPVEALVAMRDDLARSEPGPFFMGKPDRWYEPPGPRFRCTRGHVIGAVLKSEGLGRDACLSCQAPVVLTFPEDTSDSAVRT